MKNSNDKSIFQTIRETHDILETAENLGISLKKQGRSYRSGSRGSLAIYPDTQRFKDFERGIHGDVIDLVATFKYNGDKHAAIRELAPDELRKQIDATFEDEKLEQDFISQCQSTLINPEFNFAIKAIEYLHSRKIQDETIKAQRLGYDLNCNAVVIPFLDERGTLVKYHTERLLNSDNGQRYKSATINNFLRPCPLGLNTLNRNNSELWICEGVFDYLSLFQEGFTVLCTAGGSGMLDTLQYINPDFERVILAFDNDDGGRGFTLEFSHALFKRGINFDVVSLLSGVKDLSDYYCAGYDLNELADNALPGLEFLARSYAPQGSQTRNQERKTQKDLKYFLIDVFRGGADKSDIALITDKLAETGVSRHFLNAIIKKAENGESENEIVTKLTEKYTLLFHEKTGFYEYQNDGIWHSKTETAIAAHVMDYLGHTAKNRQITAVVSHMEKAVNSDIPVEQFNKKSLLVFKNGTFDVNSGRLLDHSELDYSTVLLDYDFDESAQCPMWLKFIDDVTAGDKGRAAVLQEYAGYVLCPDCRFAKALILKGEGGNGKNIFANTLRFVFGVDNCSSEVMRNLGKPFYAIGLKDKLLNIAGENQGSIRGSEDMFKSIVSGDSITDSYKGKERFSFITRVKFIILMNKFLFTDDDSNGFLRRLLFVNFPVKFVDEPQGEFQKKIDVDLDKKLKKERSGIFNWCYEGAKRLLKQGRFTVIDDQQANIKQFKRYIDDVFEFVDEVGNSFIDKRILRDDIFNRYLKWCEDCAIKNPKSKNRFFEPFRKALTDYAIKFAEIRVDDKGKLTPYGKRYFEFLNLNI